MLLAQGLAATGGTNLTTGDDDEVITQALNNVELVVAEKIGAETTTYVRNIYKYYVGYKLTLEAQEVQRKARESVAPPGP